MTDISQMYDQLSDPFAGLGAGNIHLGYFEGPGDPATLAEAADRLTEQLIARLPVARDHLVLDVGCGVGKPALRLAGDLGVRVVGVSISETQIGIANEAARAAGLADRVSFRYADAMRLPFADASFDGVWAMESLHHMTDRPQALREVARVLRHGGVLSIADFVQLGPVHEQDQEAMTAFRSGGGVHTLTGIAEYEAEIADAGLTLTSSSDISANVRPSMMGTAEAIRGAADAFLPLMGEEGLRRLIDNFERAATVPQIGYALFAARRS
ncbi:SAM-dependent methyltransferase [Nonomuraea jiangxiensis]|uniref:27-O-demethylrifamycin SV methyltransferase n=1 Tax=Nonomuraea jiangxiensis TaxID=633440 RepID=A0A1G8RY15_9ACTN|nr:methyltransferase domain-containing protein [Nonomuraea jiangxiensis]SDJ21822.1 27-O-demethylrifamycin SV methyltransferase [Nonomuraea jiangxiensis]